LLAAFADGCKKQPHSPPPPEVQVVTVASTNVPIYEEWIGSLDGYVNAQIHAQVTGYLLKQNYAEGSQVKKDDLLFEIDPRPFQATLDQTLAKLAQDKAQLAKTDDAVQANRSAQALVQADEAAIESARLNLGFTRITSPVDGVAGTALGQIGDLVSASGPVLTTVSTLDPIKVYIQVSEQSYLTFWRRFISATETNLALPLELVLSDGSVFPQKGRFFFAGRQVHLTTGTLRVAGLFPNPGFVLRPGQYALVRAQTQVVTNAIVLPQRAVAEEQGAFHVAVVGEDNKAHVKSVKTGSQVGSDWVIESGLKPGEVVVVEGTQKAKEGTVVNPKPLAASGGGGFAASAAR
jgi:membrane fusion protein (multidrug efflux system)